MYVLCIDYIMQTMPDEFAWTLKTQIGTPFRRELFIFEILQAGWKETQGY